jgi:hypothetical protein
LAEILGAERIIQEGMRSRVEDAIKVRSKAVSTALTALASLGITERQLQLLIDAHIKDAADRLRQTLKAA